MQRLGETVMETGRDDARGVNKVSLINIAADICKVNGITYKGIILHGSQAVGFANMNSDFDLLVVTDELTRIKIETIINGDREKIQIEFIDLQSLRGELSNYEANLLNRMMDLNILAGRLFMCKILFEEDTLLSGLIETYKPYKNKKKLIEKFFYQAINFYTDSKTNDLILKDYSLDLMVKSIGISYLIYHDIYWLNIKWQHRFIENIMEPQLFEYYQLLRLNRLELSDEIINQYVKALLEPIKL